MIRDDYAKLNHANQKPDKAPSEFLSAMDVLSTMIPLFAIFFTMIVYLWHIAIISDDCPSCLLRLPVPAPPVAIPLPLENVVRQALIVVPILASDAALIVPSSFIGALLALALAMLLAVVLRARLTRAEMVDPRRYGEIQNSLAIVQGKLDGLEPYYGCCPAYSEASKLATRIRCLLDERGSHWMTGHGYVQVSILMHKAEEALISIEPEPSVVEGAFRDVLCIKDSTFQESYKASLNRTVVSAVKVLIPEAAGYFAAVLGIECQPDAPPSRASHSPVRAALTRAPGLLRRAGAKLGARRKRSPAAASSSTPAAAADATWQSPMDEDHRAARIALRAVRHTVNTFRDDRLAALEELRGRAWRVLRTVGIVVFLLIVAIIDLYLPSHFHPDQSSSSTHIAEGIAAAAFYFLIGVVMGFLPQLRDAQRGQSQSATALGTALPLVTLALSGLAALGGVVVVYGAAQYFGIDLVPSLQGTSPFGADVFGWILIAALFGLAPGLLLDGVQQYANKLTRDLQAINPSPPTAANPARTDGAPAAGS